MVAWIGTVRATREKGPATRRAWEMQAEALRLEARRGPGWGAAGVAVALAVGAHLAASASWPADLLTGRMGWPLEWTGALLGLTVAAGGSLALGVVVRRLRTLRARRRAEDFVHRIERACTASARRRSHLLLRGHVLRPGLSLGFDAVTGEDVFVPDAHLRRHGIVFGTTGTGKSRLLLYLAWQQMLRGGGLIYVDAKRQEATIREFAWMCRQAGRLWDLRLLDGGDRFRSHRYNVLSLTSGDTVSQLEQRVSALMPPVDQGSDAQHYRELIGQNVVQILDLFVETGKAFTVRDLYEFLREPRVALRLLEEDLRAAGRQEAVARLYRFGRDFMDRQQERRFQEQMSTLIASLRRILDEEMVDILTASRGEVDLKEVALKGRILYVALPFMSNREVAAHFVRGFQEHLKHLIGFLSERRSVVGEGPPPVLVVLDEFGSYANPEFAAVVQMARSANVSVWFGVQTPSRLQAREMGLSPSFARDVLNNCGTVVTFLVRDPHDAQWLSGRWGEEWKGQVTLSVGEGSSTGEERATPKKWLNPRETRSQSLNEGLREVNRPTVPPSVLTQGLKWVREGRGRAVVEVGGSEPRIVDTGWVEVTPPDDFDVRRAQPRLRPVAANPLALHERIGAVIGELALRKDEGGDQDPPGDSRAQAERSGRRGGKDRPSRAAAPPPWEDDGPDGLGALRWLLGLEA